MENGAHVDMQRTEEKNGQQRPEERARIVAQALEPNSSASGQGGLISDIRLSARPYERTP